MGGAGARKVGRDEGQTPCVGAIGAGIAIAVAIRVKRRGTQRLPRPIGSGGRGTGLRARAAKQTPAQSREPDARHAGDYEQDYDYEPGGVVRGHTGTGQEPARSASAPYPGAAGSGGR